MASSDPETPRPDTAIVEELFDRLLDMSPEERHRALAEESVDDAVRTRVRRLLEHFDEPRPALDEPVVGADSVPAAATVRSVGPYDVLGLIGVGAMGVVYRAEQASPRREVALKLMRTLVDAELGARRFEREAELLGRLQHPGIAQIFESGTAEIDGGRAAYIAMELIDGRPLGEYADAAGLDLRARVTLLIDLCEAVHHAHLKGVIHRDLKPNNVLVTQEGEVKVIDFGVARAAEVEEGDLRTTQSGQVIGTLAYMSPEQVRGDLDLLDARTDVYGLGALAYELLSGRLPHDLEGMTVFAAAKVIAERDVPRLGAITPACRGDLDWIVGRALDKHPAARYQSADALARDLRRWLAHEPVEARPPSTINRVVRYAQRHRAVAAGLAIATIALVAATGVSTTFAVVNARLAKSEKRASTEARELAELADQRAEEASRAREDALEQAEIARREAESTRQTSNFLIGLFEKSYPERSLGEVISARELLDAGAARVHSELRGQPLVRAQMMRTLGIVYKRLGLYESARPLLEEALSLLEEEQASSSDIGSTMVHVGEVAQYEGRLEDAAATYDRALALGTEMHDDRLAAEALSGLAGISLVRERFDEAEEQLAAAIELSGDDPWYLTDTLDKLAASIVERDPEEALRTFQQILDVSEAALDPRSPRIGVALVNLGMTYLRLGQPDEARLRLERAVDILETALGPEHLHVGAAYLALANCLPFEEAEPLYRIGLEIQENAAGDNVSFGANLTVIAARFANEGRAEDAIPLLERSIEILEADGVPNDPRLGSPVEHLAAVLSSVGRHDEALGLFDRAIGLREGAQGPNHPRTALAYYNYGNMAAGMRRFEDAIPALEEALVRLEAVLGPDHPSTVQCLDLLEEVRAAAGE